MIETFPQLTKKSHELQKLHALDPQKFAYELACWVVDEKIIWNDFRILHYPVQPDMVQQYYRMQPEQRKNIRDTFWSEKEVKFYFDQKENIRNANCQMRRFLESCLKDLPVSETERRSKITEKIFDFREGGF